MQRDPLNILRTPRATRGLTRRTTRKKLDSQRRKKLDSQPAAKPPKRNKKANRGGRKLSILVNSIKKRAINMNYKQQIAFNQWTIDEKDYDFIVQLVAHTNTRNVLEIGPGASTFAFLENGCTIDSWEPSKTWFGVAAKKFAKFSDVTVHYLEDDIVPAKQYDIAFVDSIRREKFVRQCGHIANLVLLHDANREGPGAERALIARLKGEGWDVTIAGGGRGLAVLRPPRRKLLVIACPRSGTTFAAKYFSALGLSIGHEGIRRDGTSSWMYAVNASAYPWGHGNNRRDKFYFEHIFHQIRNPIDAISSFEAISKPSWNFMAKFVDFGGLTELERRMKLWIEWNKICEKQATYTYRVENINNEFDEICNKLSIGHRTIPSISTSVNQRPHGTVTYDDLKKVNSTLFGQVMAMAGKFGY